MPVPAVASGVNEVVLRVELISLLGTPAAIHVGDRRDLAVLDRVQQRGEDPPGLGKLISPDKVHLGADKDVENESLVGVRQPGVLVPRVVGHVQLGLLHVKADSRSLGHHLGVDGFSRLNSEHKLIPLGHAIENITGDITVLDTNFGLALVESLAALQDEGNTVPPLVLDPEAGGSEGRSDRSGRNGGIVQVSNLAVVILPIGVANVLAQNNVVQGDLLARLQYLDLLVADVIRAAKINIKIS